MALIWLKPLGLFIYPSHKWDGNELNHVCLQFFIAVGFNQRMESIYEHGFSLNNQHSMKNEMYLNYLPE
jgi:hypothetical protein